MKSKLFLNNKTINEFIDYYISCELLNRNSNNKMANNIQAKMINDHKICLGKSAILRRINGVIKHERLLKPAADVNGLPSKRDSKDINYAHFWGMVDTIFTPTEYKSYIGLPFNQIDIIANKFDYITICEIDKKRYCQIEKINEIITKPKYSHKQINIINDNIYNHLEGSRYNVIDLDLMNHIPSDKKEIDLLAKKIYLASRNGKIALHLAFSVGRNNTLEDHNKQTDKLKIALENYFNIRRWILDKHQDRFMPIRTIKAWLEN